MIRRSIWRFVSRCNQSHKYFLRKSYTQPYPRLLVICNLSPPSCFQCSKGWRRHNMIRHLYVVDFLSFSKLFLFLASTGYFDEPQNRDKQQVRFTLLGLSFKKLLKFERRYRHVAHRFVSYRSPYNWVNTRQFALVIHFMNHM